MNRVFIYKGRKYYITGKFRDDGDFPRGYYSAVCYSKELNGWCSMYHIKESTIQNAIDAVKNEVDRMEEVAHGV